MAEGYQGQSTNNQAYSNSDDSDDFMEESGLKEEIYKEKLNALKKQLEQVKDRSHPEFKKRMKKIETANKDRIYLAEMNRDLERQEIERDYAKEKRAAQREFEEKKAELKVNLIMECEEKKKMIEQERYSLDLNGDSLEYKAASTRKLRRRGAEPTPTVEKRRKNVTNGLQYLLDEKEIDEDLKNINKNKNNPKQKGLNTSLESHSNEPRIENGKLYFDKKWFHKGQAVMVDCKDGSRFNAVLVCADSNSVVMRKAYDNMRIRITLGQLAHGKFLVRRRNANSNQTP